MLYHILGWEIFFFLLLGYTSQNMGGVITIMEHNLYTILCIRKSENIGEWNFKENGGIPITSMTMATWQESWIENEESDNEAKPPRWISQKLIHVLLLHLKKKKKKIHKNHITIIQLQSCKSNKWNQNSTWHLDPPSFSLLCFFCFLC